MNPGRPKDRNAPLRQPMFSALSVVRTPPLNLSAKVVYLQRTPETPTDLFTLEELYNVMMIGYERIPRRGPCHTNATSSCFHRISCFANRNGENVCEKTDSPS